MITVIRVSLVELSLLTTHNSGEDGPAQELLLLLLDTLLHLLHIFRGIRLNTVNILMALQNIFTNQIIRVLESV